MLALAPKICVSDVLVRHGVLLLDSFSVQFLGGSVKNLEAVKNLEDVSVTGKGSDKYTDRSVGGDVRGSCGVSNGVEHVPNSVSLQSTAGATQVNAVGLGNVPGPPLRPHSYQPRDVPGQSINADHPPRSPQLDQTMPQPRHDLPPQLQQQRHPSLPHVQPQAPRHQEQQRLQGNGTLRPSPSPFLPSSGQTFPPRTSPVPLPSSHKEASSSLSVPEGDVYRANGGQQQTLPPDSRETERVSAIGRASPPRRPESYDATSASVSLGVWSRVSSGSGSGWGHFESAELLLDDDSVEPMEDAVQVLCDTAPPRRISDGMRQATSSLNGTGSPLEREYRYAGGRMSNEVSSPGGVMGVDVEDGLARAERFGTRDTHVATVEVNDAITGGERDGDRTLSVYDLLSPVGVGAVNHVRGVIRSSPVSEDSRAHSVLSSPLSASETTRSVNKQMTMQSNPVVIDISESPVGSQEAADGMEEEEGGGEAWETSCALKCPCLLIGVGGTPLRWCLSKTT